ncbi:5-oxoprolinase subunit PxpB [Dyella terrae]|nr:5-oxoprolinase subunit PxpB [Dyella terrae]ULU25906.1 5-oxoprolinase subunit PxpB [Dyella terrae]
MSHPFANLQLEALAEDAWLLRFGETIDVAVNARVHTAAALLRAHLPDIECVPAYASLLLRVDLDVRSSDGLRETIEAALSNPSAPATGTREVIVPVWYGDEAGADLQDVAAHARMSAEEVIARHSAPAYHVAMLGFAPGFPYLLGLDPALSMPRRSQPRTSVPAGSVAIGGLQTGIYPQALPGGWHLIGRTPMHLFDLGASSPSLCQPGDRVRFQVIDEHEYRRLAVDAGAAR